MPVKAGRAYMGKCINIMVQALQTEDGSLPQGLTVQNTYTEFRQGSRKAVAMVRNNTAYPQTLWKKTPVARVVAALPCPNPLRKSNCWRGLMSPMNPISLDWPLGKDMVNCLMNSTWVAWIPGPPNWQTQLISSWPNTMTCSHWIQQNWVVDIPQNIQ